MCSRRVCGSTPGDWDANNPVLAVSLRRCRTTAYPSSAVPRFTNMLLSPRPFGSRSVVRLGVFALNSGHLWWQFLLCVTRRTLSPHTAHERGTFTGSFHFANSTDHSPWSACAFVDYLCTVSLDRKSTRLNSSHSQISYA